MLIQAKAPYGRTSVEAMSVPSASEMPQPWPIASMRRQSASFWFQFAALERAKQPATCCKPSVCSVLAVTRLEVGRLAEVGQAARDPVRLPVEHRGERHARRAKQTLRRAGVDQPGGGRFLAGDHGLLAKALAEFLSQRAHAHDVGSADVDRQGRRSEVCEEPQRMLVSIAM